MAVEMDDEGARRRIADFGCHLMADALALIERDIVLRAPLAGADMEFLLLRRRHRHHVIDEDAEALGLGDLVDAELLLHLLEIDVGVAGKIVGKHEVGLGHDLVPCPDSRKAGGAGEDFLRDRVSHGFGLAHCVGLPVTTTRRARRNRAIPGSSNSSGRPPA